MKRYLLIALLAVAVSVSSLVVVGCLSPSAQKVAVNTIFSVQSATHAAYETYIVAVGKGAVATNGVPSVVHALVKFDASTVVALDAVQFNTNAVAPPFLSQSSQDLINLITKLSKK